MSERVTQAEFARQCRVSRKTVTKWKAQDRIAVVGGLVDVAASTELLERYRRDGLPSGLREARRLQTEPVENCARGPAVVTMTRAALRAAIEAADWTDQPRDWSDVAQIARMHAAARSLALVALQSTVRDDGHHGGWQLRDAAPLGVCVTDSVMAGYGYELEPFEVIEECRRIAEIFAEEYPDETVTVDPQGIAALAFPHLRFDQERRTP